MQRAIRIFDAGLVRKVSAGKFVVKIESPASLEFKGSPIGIVRTLYLECEKAFERIEE